MKYHQIKNYIPLNWSDIYWAYKNQMIGWRDIVSYASDCIKDGDTDVLVINIAFVDKNNLFYLNEVLPKLGEHENEHTKKKWLYIKLRYCFENMSLYNDPLAEVESIYADFDYPHEIESFVRYMPKAESTNSQNECITELYKSWENYLIVSHRKLKLV